MRSSLLLSAADRFSAAIKCAIERCSRRNSQAVSVCHLVLVDLVLIERTILSFDARFDDLELCAENFTRTLRDLRRELDESSIKNLSTHGQVSVNESWCASWCT